MAGKLTYEELEKKVRGLEALEAERKGSDMMLQRLFDNTTLQYQELVVERLKFNRYF